LCIPSVAKNWLYSPHLKANDDNEKLHRIVIDEVSTINFLMAKFPLELILLLKSILPKGIAAIAPYPVTIPRYNQHMAIRRSSPPPSGRVERVVLARLTENLRPFWFLVGTIEGTVGDDVLVRFGAVVVQVSPEIPELFNENLTSHQFPYESCPI
jgi:hypothetical protein